MTSAVDELLSTLADVEVEGAAAADEEDAEEIDDEEDAEEGDDEEDAEVGDDEQEVKEEEDEEAEKESVGDESDVGAMEEANFLSCRAAGSNSTSSAPWRMRSWSERRRKRVSIESAASRNSLTTSTTRATASICCSSDVSLIYCKHQIRCFTKTTRSLRIEKMD